MGNTNSMCESLFGESLDLRKSSLNMKDNPAKNNADASTKAELSRVLRNSSIYNSNGSNQSPGPTEVSEKKIKEKHHLMRLEDFNLVNVLGRGSYGKIFLAQKKSNNKFYALKTIKKSALQDPRLKQSILTERNVLLHSNHPFVMKLRYSFQTDSRIYMVMDFCQGGELLTHINKSGKLDESAVRFYTVEIILAIQYLHEKLSTIHRDIKPENMLINVDGHIKVTDFGLSKAARRTNSICGTREYLAPEVLLGRGYDNSIDWWSLGCLIYEMAVGHPPFTSEDKEQISYDILINAPDIPKHVSSELNDLITKLLTKNPVYRLGRKTAEDIKAHSFFKDVNWEAYMNKDVIPPFIPIFNGRDDVSSFSMDFVREPAKETPSKYRSKNTVGDDDIQHFSFIGQASQLPSIADLDGEDNKTKLDGGQGKLLITL